MYVLIAGLIAVLSAPPSGGAPSDSDGTPLIAGVHVNARRGVITVVVGPFDVPAMDPGMVHAMHDETPGTMPLEFIWPVDGWFRGFETEIMNERGDILSRRLLHHFTLVNFDRRGLFNPTAERIASGSLKSEQAMAPKSIGAPMLAGQRMGVFVMWRNQTGRDVSGVYLRLSLVLSPANLLPRPVSALPIVLDVGYRPGQPNTFDVPPGRTERSAEVVFPISGRLLVASGHTHDQGESVRLEDVATGRVLIRVTARRDAAGNITGMSRRLLALWGPGLRIKAGRRYRVVVVYNNVRPDTARHEMGELIGIFAPDDMRRWVPVDYSDPLYLHDVAASGARLDQRLGEASHRHEHRMP